MEYLLLGFFTGLSLILAIGAQNIFVIEQGLKKQHIFLVCIVCSTSDLILIFLGIFLFHYFTQYFNSIIELVFDIPLSETLIKSFGISLANFLLVLRSISKFFKFITKIICPMKSCDIFSTSNHGCKVTRPCWCSAPSMYD